MAYEFHYTPTGTGVISGKEVLEQTEDAINDLSGQISGDVQIAIDTANNALNTANTASADAQNAINSANTAYTAATNAQNTANTAQNTASSALTAAQNAQNDVNALGNRVTTAENNISQNTSDISGLTTRMGTAEGNIGNLQTAVSTAQATANSAQQTATTARQQSYVFRYSSTALVASSTNSNALLDNTDNLKVGDKVIDSSGVLFSITAIDTQNSTFTIGTALIDLAQDSDVVHKSGDETINGNKTFTNTIKSTKEIELTGNRLAYILPEFSAGYSGLSLCTYDANGAVKIGIWKVDDNDNTKHVLNYSLGYLSVSTGSSNSINIVYLTPRNASKAKLGDSVNKWHEINGVEPSSLSLPLYTSRLDISGYITDLSGGNNPYTPLSNGWVFVRSDDATELSITDVSSGVRNASIYPNATSLGLYFPVVKERAVYIKLKCTTVSIAVFIPCQGNV